MTYLKHYCFSFTMSTRNRNFTTLKHFTKTRKNIVHHVKIEDFYKGISSDIQEWFYTSGCEASKGEIDLVVDKKVIGKCKDETGAQVISQLCANRSKSYSFKVNKEAVSKNTLKGIVQAVRTEMITFNNSTSCVFEDEAEIVEQTRFKTDEHVIIAVTRTKIALESTDN